MPSAQKLFGYLLQFLGMAIMLYGFVILVMDVQKVVGYSMDATRASAGLQQPIPQGGECDPQTDELCGIGITSEGAVEQLMSGKVYRFIYTLGAGLALVFLGVLLRSLGEIGGFFKGGKQRGVQQRIKVGRLYGPDGKLI